MNDSFTETSIRPDDLMGGAHEAYSLDIKWLLERKDQFVDVACPACGGNNGGNAFLKNNFHYLLCPDCKTIYISPRPTLDLLREFYRYSKGYKYWNKYIFPASENARRENIFKPRARKLIELSEKYAIHRQLFVEVGAGYGTFSEEIYKSAYFKKVIAIELTPELAETCKNKGINVINKAVEDVALIDKADVVATFEVIEHLFDPKKTILGCANLLNKGGLLIITCPNINGFDNLVLGTISSTIDHEHLNYFNPKSLALLISNCGFDVIELLTPGKLDAEIVRKQTINGNISLDNQPFLASILLDRWEELGVKFQKFLSDNLLSGHMWIVGRKK